MIGPEAPPPFPVGALSPAWATWVRENAAIQQVAEDIPATISLGVVSVVAAWKTEPLLIADGVKTSPLNLYTVAVEESGANKSGVFSDAVAPVRELERRLRDDPEAEAARERRAAEIKAATARFGSLEDALKAMKKAEATGKTWGGKSNDVLIEELANAQLALAALPVPAIPRILCDDATPEALVPLLEHNPAVCLATSEAHGVFALFTGRYGNGPNLELLLKGWDGEPMTVDRRTRDPVRLERPLIALALAAQPVTVERLADFDGDLNERGLLGRVLWAMPRTMVGRRHPPGDTPLAQRTRDGYHTMVRWVHEATPSRDDDGRPRPMRLNAGARSITAAFYRETEPRIGDGGDLAWCRSMVSKMRVHLLRFAGLLHLCDGHEPDLPIDEDTTARAVELARYYLAMGQRAFSAMREPEDVAAARKVWAFIRRHAAPVGELEGAKAITQRDLYQRARGSFGRVEALAAPLALLTQHGHVAAVERRGGGQGRPPTPWIIVNPEALR